MVADPPYGVGLEPEWREEAGLNPRTRQGGKVANDDRIDWSQAWALLPDPGRHPSPNPASFREPRLGQHHL